MTVGRASMQTRLTAFVMFREHSAELDDSIRSILGQSFADFELLVLNDGDPAESDIIRDHHPDSRLRIVETPGLGLARSRDVGLREARGEYLAILDSDDLADEGRFARQVEFLDSHPSCVLVGSWLRVIDGRGHPIGIRKYPTDDAEIRREMPIRNCIAQPAVMLRRAAAIEAGGYTTEFAFAEDYDLWLRMARLGTFHNLPEPLTRYRVHPGGGKATRTKLALRDTIRVRFRAVRDYGFTSGPRFWLALALQLPLRLLPGRVVFLMFEKLLIRDIRR